MIVSHDSGFLDKTCSHIIHYENRKLKTYRVCTLPQQPLLPLTSRSLYTCTAPSSCRTACTHAAFSLPDHLW